MATVSNKLLRRKIPLLPFRVLTPYISILRYHTRRIERSQHDVYPFISYAEGLENSAKAKTVLITGGGTGIGMAMATHFALAGARTVIISGRNPSTLHQARLSIKQRAPNCEVVTHEADVTDSTSVMQLFDNLPRVPDIVINNAGSQQSKQRLCETEPVEWWLDFETNLKGMYQCSRAYLRLLAGNSGTILNVSSSMSEGVFELLSSYAISKSAVNRLTEYIHTEHSNDGVCCIAFHPGSIADTVMAQSTAAHWKPFLNDTVDLAGGTALYLSIPRAKFLSGRFVMANWNMEQVELLKDTIVREDLLKTRSSLGKYFKSDR